MVIPEIEPAEIRSGDTIKWNRTDLTDYPATTWTLKYYLVKAGTQIVVIASASGDAHSIVLSKAATAAYPVGQYAWIAKASNGTEEYTVDSGNITVLPDLVASATGLETRSDARKIYDDLIAAYKSYISSNSTMQAFSVAGKSVSFKSTDDLLTQIRHWAAIVAQEEDQERIDDGKPSRNIIKAVL